VLTNFPVLVVFSNNINNSAFHYGYFATTNGYDLRFGTDARPTTNSLNYEIESWNPNGASYIWVQVPTIPANGTGTIWANWGNTNAINQLPCTTNGATWDTNFKGVWHMPNGTTISGADSTANTNNGTVASVTAASGQIGGCGYFSGGAGTNIYAGTNSSLTISGALTLSVWAKMTTNKTQVLIGRWRDNPYGYALFQAGNLMYAAVGTNNGNVAVSSSYTTTNQWDLWHNVYIPSTSLSLYRNGVLVSQITSGVPAANTGTAIFKIGGSTLADYPFAGFLDEGRISASARSTNWVWAEYLNMASNTVFNSYGKMEPFIAKGTVILLR
jgi:hypothetical protein